LFEHYIQNTGDPITSMTHTKPKCGTNTGLTIQEMCKFQHLKHVFTNYLTIWTYYLAEFKSRLKVLMDYYIQHSNPCEDKFLVPSEW